MSTVGDDDVLRSPVPTPDSVLGERERVASALFGRPSTPKRVGRYAVEAVFGRGAMGVVYEAWDEELQRTVAVKLISRDMDIGNAEHRFRREALALAKLAHPNVVTIHEVGSHEGRLFLAMELVRGQTLDAWLAEEPRGWEAVLEVFVQAGRGLDAAHAAGLVHRDFKPANCIVGESGRVRVLDFGLARGVADLLDDEVAATAPVVSTLDVSVTRTGATVGTPAYMAPEQLRGGEVSAASDQFAFCVALYEALAGVRPFAGKSIVELHENIEAGRLQDGQGRAPAELMRVVQRGLSVSATERWPTVGELVDALEDVPQRRGRRRRLWSMAGGGALAAAVAGAAWLPEAPCGDVPTTDVWNEERRAELREAIGDGPVWRAMDRAASDWTHTWDSIQRSSCEAARIEHSINEVSRARQQACLQRHQSTLAVVLEKLSQSENPSQATPAVIRGLPSVDDCASTDALIRVEPPASAAGDAVAEARRRVDESLASSLLGDLPEAFSAIKDAEVLAEELEYGPLDAEIALQRAWVQRYRASDDALDAIHEALAAAEAAG
ncbi:MAG: serine/threonine-protein kinase [Nannocystaceae bacterium]|nr:serine/threonine protein kinase [bacterium]